MSYLKTLLILFFCVSFCCAEQLNKKILVISSDNASNLWNQRLMEGLRASLGKSQISISLDISELNVDNSMDMNPRSEIVEALRFRLDKIKYDLIITSGNAATDIFIDKKIVVPNTPLLFFNYQCFKLNDRKKMPWMTGFVMPESSTRNIQMGLKLFPNTRNVIVLLDGGSYGNSIRKCINDEKYPNSVKIEFISGQDYSTAEMLKKLKLAQKNSFVVMNRWQSQKEPAFTRPEIILPLVLQNYSGPIFGTFLYQMNMGVLGGLLADGFEHGTDAGNLAARILRGEKTENIPIMESKAHFMFDYSLIEKFKITSSELPPNSKFINIPLSWSERHFKELQWVGIILCIGFCVSSFWLFYFIRFWKNMYRDQMVLNDCLEKLFLSEDYNSAVEAMLKIFCDYFKASRCYILKFDFSRWKATCFAEYNNIEKKKMFEKDKEYPISPEEPWVNAFKYRKMVNLFDMRLEKNREFIGKWSSGYVDEFDMRSLFVSPIYIDNQLWGDVGIMFENHPRERFNKRERYFLNASSRLIEILLERKETHSKLRKALEQAQSAEKAKGFFIASVSHEIRTPLNSIIGFSELIRHGNEALTGKQREYVDNIVYSSNALLQFINDVLDISKLESGTMKIILKPVDFIELGNESMQIFSFRVIKNSLELRTEIPDLPKLELDIQHIRQILFNLIGNAVKFTKDGFVCLRAKFRPYNEKYGEFEFSVTDTGCGISKEDQKHILEPFVRLSNFRGTNTTNEGTGLGLAICKRLAEKMGGRLWVKSEINKGSTFGVTFERVKYLFSNIQSSTVIKNMEIPEKEFFQKLTVLIVDDVILNLKVLYAMLRKLGIENIVQVQSATEALVELEKRQFDFILTDLWMPKINGIELLRRIRMNERFVNMAVILVTADSEMSGGTEFDGILLKPITLVDLQKVLLQTKKK
jgi:multi-sensor hybrid histidine kinase